MYEIREIHHGDVPVLSEFTLSANKDTCFDTRVFREEHSIANIEEKMKILGTLYVIAIYNKVILGYILSERDKCTPGLQRLQVCLVARESRGRAMGLDLLKGHDKLVFERYPEIDAIITNPRGFTNETKISPRVIGQTGYIKGPFGSIIRYRDRG